jgi:glycosyltransferase involved in cell wall biosynthesis
VQRDPSASIVVPTRARPDYLDVTLTSIAPQAQRAEAEIVVVTDGPDPSSAGVAERHGAKLVSLERPSGPNAARNAGLREAASDLLVFIDDDVEAPDGWLDALLAAVGSAPDCEVFGGPIRARLEGGGPRTCGREPAPITALDRGTEDRDVALVWGANMAIRRSALERIGSFDESIFGGRGDEEEWERRYIAGGGRIRYVAGAGLDHRRTAADARLGVLARAAYGHGRAARRNDRRHGAAPSIARELRAVAGCAWHTVRRRCANGIVMLLHSAGRLHEAVAERRS